MDGSHRFSDPTDDASGSSAFVPDDAVTVDADFSEAPSRSWKRLGSKRKGKLITDARRTAYQNRIHREKIYMIIQLSRVPFLALTFAAFLLWHSWFWTIVFFIISVPLPGIAVVLANEKGEKRDKRERQTYKPAQFRAMEQQRYDALEQQRAQQIAAPDNSTVIDHEE